jgi:phage tail-like protein
VPRYDPPVSFYFTLSIANPLGMMSVDMEFREIGGIGAELATEDVRDGGTNDTVYRLPTQVNYPNLRCARGLAPMGSTLLPWCFSTFSNTGGVFVPMNIVVSLLNRDAMASPYMVWTFYDALPVKWSVSDFNAMNSEVAIEFIEFQYTRLLCVPGVYVPTMT